MTTEKLFKVLKKQIRNVDICERIHHIVDMSLAAVDPYACVKTALKHNKDLIFQVKKPHAVTGCERLVLISVGKAAIAMARACIDHFGGQITEGIVVAKHLSSVDVKAFPKQIQGIQGGHPIPDKGSIQAGEAILSALAGLTQKDGVLFCISGGGSALLTKPYKGIGLDDLQVLTGNLLRSGARIDEINTIRKHLDQVKGGGLAKAASPARMLTLVLSDVVGDPLDMIASGPTVPDETNFIYAWQVLEKYALLENAPKPILDHLQRGIAGEIPETPKDSDPIFNVTQVAVVGSNIIAAKAGLNAASEVGYNPKFLSSKVQGEAQSAGRDLGALVQDLALGSAVSRPACMIAGGETTVTIKGDGLGGRNLEVALGAARVMDGLERVAFISLATDGEDGPTDAAGAIVTGKTMEEARKLGLDAPDYLARNDTYHFFEKLGGLIKLGPTGTNVNDLYFLIAY